MTADMWDLTDPDDHPGFDDLRLISGDVEHDCTGADCLFCTAPDLQEDPSS